MIEVGDLVWAKDPRNAIVGFVKYKEQQQDFSDFIYIIFKNGHPYCFRPHMEGGCNRYNDTIIKLSDIKLMKILLGVDND